MNLGGDGVRARPPCSRAGCLQSGSELSSRLDALSAEKAELSSAVQRQEADLLAAQGLVREKEAALSQEQQRGSRETAELQRQLADKVTPRLPPPPPQQQLRRDPACFPIDRRVARPPCTSRIFLLLQKETLHPRRS